MYCFDDDFLMQYACLLLNKVWFRSRALRITRMRTADVTRDLRGCHHDAMTLFGFIARTAERFVRRFQIQDTLYSISTRRLAASY